MYRFQGPKSPWHMFPEVTISMLSVSTDRSGCIFSGCSLTVSLPTCQEISDTTFVLQAIDGYFHAM